MTTNTDQRLPEGWHFHAQDGSVLPAPDADCGRGDHAHTPAGPRPPLALPCAGARVLAFPQRESRRS